MKSQESSGESPPTVRSPADGELVTAFNIEHRLQIFLKGDGKSVERKVIEDLVLHDQSFRIPSRSV